MTTPTYYLVLDQATRSDVPIIEVVDGHLVARGERDHDDPLTVESLVLLPVSRRLVTEITSATSLTVYVVVLEQPQADDSPLLAHLTAAPARGVPCAFSAVRVGDLDGNDAPTITADQDEMLLVQVGRSTYPVRSMTILPTSRLVLVEVLDDADCLAVVAFELADEEPPTKVDTDATTTTVTLTLTSDQAAMVVDALRLVGDFVQEAARAEPYYDLAALVGQQAGGAS